MQFEQALEQTVALLTRYGRISYRGLKRQLEVNDEFLEDLKAELVDVLRLATDEDGKVLVWAGGAAPAAAPAAPAAVSVAASAPAESASPDVQAASASNAERRQLTVMFCDLVDATALANRLDPEDLHEIVRAYQGIVTEVTDRMGGHIAQYLGDGVLIYFGYPQAHEDDARRSVSSALEIVANLAELRRDLESRFGERLAVRIGIHTGEVVVGEIGTVGRHEQLALGETPNIAARVQALAEPDTVVVTSSAWRLADGYFHGESLGEPVLKGVAQPIAVFRVVGESGAQTRLDIAGRGGLTPLIGRESEARLLQQRWAQARDGRGQIILLSGEAGIGKSRLVSLMQEHAERDGGRRIMFRCSPYHANSSFHPLIDHFSRVMRLERTDSDEEKRTKLARVLADYQFVNERAHALLARLLSVPWPDDDAIQTLSPPQLKQRTQEALAAWLIEEAERRPVLAVWEDLHWADPSTLELFGLLMDQVPVAPMLMFMTFRPDFIPPWPPHSYVSQLALNRLTQDEAEAMISRIVHPASLPREVVQQVVAKTDGVPLFVEELLKMILESGLLRETDGRYVLTGPLPPLAIPATLQDSLMARLDRLSTARDIAQVGAAIGRDFSYALIREVAAIPEESLQRGLANLVDAELIYQRGRPPSATYVFKHALIRDAAYQSLLRSQRHLYHQRIADTLEQSFPDIVTGEPEVLAHHYAEAGAHEHAIMYLQRAAQRAVERSANAEAIAYLTRALDSLAKLPQDQARDRLELELRVSIGVPLIATRGYGHAEVERAFARARDLAMAVGETPQLPNILWGLWVFYLCGGPMNSALALAQQYRAVAELHPDDDALLLETCQLVGIALFYMGEFEAARELLARGDSLYDAERHHALVFAHGGADTGVAIRTHHALTLWVLGRSSRAAAAMEDAVATARSLEHPFTLAFAHYFDAWLHKLRGDEARALAAATDAVGICDEHDFPFWGLTAGALAGSCLSEQGAVAEGHATVRDRLGAYEATGGLLHLSALRGLLARATARAGGEDAVPIIDGAIGALDERDERWFEPELHRLRGAMLLSARGPHDAAESALRTACEVAARQRARAWELRAAITLTQYQSAHGGGSDGRERLRRLLDEDAACDAADMQAARALLDVPPIPT